MTKLALSIMFVAILIGAGLWGWRYLDLRSDKLAVKRLVVLQPLSPEQFSYSQIADLPEPVQRYFKFMIAEGTPLWTVAKIEMQGQFSLGTQDAPHYMAMQATQVLAPPAGFIWMANMQGGHLWFSGSDTGAWTRFWGWDVFPVARAGGTDDHARSAFGRFVAEAAFWTPAALLPGGGITWSAPQGDLIRVVVRHDAFEQSLDIQIDNEGRPQSVQLMRWSNANPDGEFRLQPFGGTVSDYRAVQGFQIPMHVEAGNFFGTDAYFPFFIAEVTAFSFPPPQ